MPQAFLLICCAFILPHSIVVPSGTQANQLPTNVEFVSILGLFVSLCPRGRSWARGVGCSGAWPNCGHRAGIGVGVGPLHGRAIRMAREISARPRLPTRPYGSMPRRATWLGRGRRAASTLSLILNLYDSVNKLSLIRLRTADLYAFFALHHERRMQFRTRVADAPFLTGARLVDTASARCSRCPESPSHVEWRESRHVMLAELERRPSGDTVLTGLEEWPAALAFWATKCKRASCLSLVYDKALSSKTINDLLDSLPNAVEVPTYGTA
jgi:hypothetical protein